MSPDTIIQQLNSIYGNYKEGSGGCVKFFLLLKMIYPEAVAYYNSEHIVSMINGKLWDSNGEVNTVGSVYMPYTYYHQDGTPFREVLTKEEIRRFNNSLYEIV